jgi:AcrR family transcriptional regulator
MGRPAASEARDTRRAILDAALDLFAERGYHATSMRALAGAVGVRESALYHHFGSKELILDAVVEERAQSRSEKIEQQIARLGNRTLSEILTTLAEEAMAHLSSPTERKFMRLVMSLGIQGPIEQSPFRRMAEGPKLMLARLITELQRTGRIRRDIDLEVFTLHFIAPILIGSGILWGGPQKVIKLPMSQLIKEHVAFLVRAAT